MLRLVPHFHFYLILQTVLTGFTAPCETLVISRWDDKKMAQYRVLVFCTDCARTHPVRATLFLDDGPIEKATVANAYKDKPLPSGLVNLLKRDILCPELAKSVPLKDTNNVYLVPIVARNINFSGFWQPHVYLRLTEPLITLGNWRDSFITTCHPDRSLWARHR